MNGIGNEIARGDSLVTRDKQLPSRGYAPRISPEHRYYRWMDGWM